MNDLTTALQHLSETARIAERLAARAPGDQLRERLRDEIAWHDSHHSEHMAINRLRAVLEETP